MKTGTDFLRKMAGRVAEDHVLPVTGDVAATVSIEEWLQGHGVAYAPASMLPMELINEKSSRNNQAREVPVIPESVERFTAALRQGTSFPPIVVYQEGGRLVIIDGNNRHESHKKAHLTEIFGIVISDETESSLIQLLTVEANARHGVTPDLSWRIHQAFHLVAMGWTDQQAADASAVSTSQLKSARSVREADARAKSLRISNFTSLPVGSRVKLGSLKDDSVFYQASHVAISTGMTIDDVSRLVREIKAQRSEADRLQTVAAVADERAIEAATRKAMGRTKSVSSAKHSLVAGIGKILAVDPVTLQRQVLTKHDKDLLELRINGLVLKLQELHVALSQLKDLEED